MVQCYPWFKFSFLLFLGIVKYDNEFETKENNIWTKDKIESQHLYITLEATSLWLCDPRDVNIASDTFKAGVNNCLYLSNTVGTNES